LPQDSCQIISKPINTLSIDNPVIDTEFIILENIYNSAEQQLTLRQRELAQIAGASLGMTNSILKRLAQKGWITVKKLNSRNIQYAITLDGINEIIHRSYRYFKRTIRNVVFFKDILEDLVFRAKRRGIHTVNLVGKSDLDFIVEHACRRWGLRFLKNPEYVKNSSPTPPGTFRIYAEGISETEGMTIKTENEEPASQSNTFYLSRLIIKQAAATGSGVLQSGHRG